MSGGRAARGRVIRAALLTSVPILAGYVVLGTGFGILLQRGGYAWPWALAMSVFIYAGSLQYVGVGLLTGGASVLTTALTSIMVNARHLFYSISMVSRYRDAGAYKPYLIFGLTDEVYTVLVDGTAPEGTDVRQYRFLVTLFCHCYWITGSVIGAVLGSVISFSTEGIEFSMTALFIASFTEQWLGGKGHIPALTGLLCTFFSLLVFGRENFLIPAMLLITLVLTVLRGRLDKNGEKGGQTDDL